MKKILLFLSSIIILYADSTDECIDFGNNGFLLRVDNKIINLTIAKNYVLINNKYKAYYKGEVNDGICNSPTDVYQNKSYTYRINQCQTADRYFINISNIYGLNSNIECSW